MHQSGHERAHSMHTVQLSSRSAITPRARIGGDSLTCGYWTVLAPSLKVRSIVAIVTPRPLTRPGTFGMAKPRPFCWRFPRRMTACSSSDGDLEDSSDDDVGERQRDQHLP